MKILDDFEAAWKGKTRKIKVSSTFPIKRTIDSFKAIRSLVPVPSSSQKLQVGSDMFGDFCTFPASKGPPISVLSTPEKRHRKAPQLWRANLAPKYFLGLERGNY
jgi:hypothetical protein